MVGGGGSPLRRFFEPPKNLSKNRVTSGGGPGFSTVTFSIFKVKNLYFFSYVAEIPSFDLKQDWPRNSQ